ncbi:membrane protein mmpL1 [Mycobacteroides abscessus subsp. abscessus]|nr:membrane protein mmpL1 [Mycobacteroides abscessus subsp. abscessus]
MPTLEETTAANAKAMIPRDAPSSAAAITQGQDFQESDYTSMAVVVLEAQGRQLGEQDHKYYDEMVRRLLDDKEHVQKLDKDKPDPGCPSRPKPVRPGASWVRRSPSGRRR